ncbi:recombinase family protein [Cytobacillus kochii]|uniref:recombinase family protein n=1 Tax=Cytobacillus kochii TaxID=859143 RepID=UPI0024818A93|nr:recombinase family protein [Cytobacillus kochii]
MIEKKNENISAVYVRVSSLKVSQKDSPEHQKALCVEKADMEDLVVPEAFIYEDRSSATTIMNRESIMQLIEDAKEGHFSTVIFASLSRFSRDGYDAIALKRTLVNALGIRLISIEDAYDSMLKDDELLFQIVSAVNQKLSEQISISSRRGIRESANKGNFTGSIAPYGYKKVLIPLGNDESRKSLEVVEEAAAIVKLIYHLYVHENMGEKRIVDYLNVVKQIPSPKGEKPWGLTTIQRILQNEAYTGVNVHNKYTVKKVYPDIYDLQNRKNVLVQRDKTKWVKNPKKEWEAIIDDDLFQKAQEIRLKRGGGKRGGIRNVQVNPFAGILKCEHCGSNFVSMKGGKVGKNGQEYRYLICSSRRRMGVKGCKNDLWIPLKSFREDIMMQITLQLENFIHIDEVAAGIEVTNSTSDIDVETRKKKLENTIKQKRKMLKKIREDFHSGKIEDEDQYEFEKEEYEDEIKKLKAQLDNLQETHNKVNNNAVIKEQVKDGLKKLVKLDFNRIDELQLVLKQLIQEITVNSAGEVKIYTPLGKL